MMNGNDWIFKSVMILRETELDLTMCIAVFLPFCFHALLQPKAQIWEW